MLQFQESQVHQCKLHRISSIIILVGLFILIPLGQTAAYNVNPYDRLELKCGETFGPKQVHNTWIDTEWVTTIFPSESLDIAIEGDYAYVFDRTGLLVYDISIPREPQQISYLILSNVTHNRAGSIVVDENFAYLGGRNGGFLVVDISNPFNPLVIANKNIWGIEDMVLSGDYVYLTGYNYDIQIVDISTPEKPIVVYLNFSNGNNGYIKVDGNYAFLVKEYGDIEILDLSNLSNPVKVATISGKFINIFTKDSILYAIKHENELNIYNVADPRSPKLLASLDVDYVDSRLSMHYTNDKLLITEKYNVYRKSGNYFIIIDVENKSNPKMLNQVPIGRNELKSAIIDNYAYIVGTFNGFEIVDFTNASNPTAYHYPDQIILERFATHSTDTGFLNNKNRIEFTFGITRNSLVLFNLTQPMNPIISVFEIYDLNNDSYTEVKDIIIHENLLYLISLKGILTLNISDINNPTLISQFNISFNRIDHVLYLKNYIYITEERYSGVPKELEEKRLHIINVTDSTKPFVEGKYIFSVAKYRPVSKIEIKDKYLFVTNGINGIHVIDISDPKNPIMKKKILPYESFHDIAVYNNYLLAYDKYVLKIFDITNPENPIEFSIYYSGENNAGEHDSYYRSIQIYGNYVITNENIFSIIDLSDIRFPVLVGNPNLPETNREWLELSDPTYYFRHYTLVGEYLYLIYKDFIQVFHITLTSNVLPVAKIDTVTSCMGDEFIEYTLKGQGEDVDGKIVGFEWSKLTNSPNISPGLRVLGNEQVLRSSDVKDIVYFRVQDNEGIWSPYLAVGCSEPKSNCYNGTCKVREPTLPIDTIGSMMTIIVIASLAIITPILKPRKQ